MPDGVAAEAEALLASLVQTSRLPRKIAERTRLALHEQRRLREPARRRRRRGRGHAGQQHLADALQLLRITVDATGEGRDVLERWTARGGRAEGEHGAGEALPLAEGAAETSATLPGQAAAGGEVQPGGRRKRRRRGGRRRRRRGAGAAAVAE